jgi:hypothetical protein
MVRRFTGAILLTIALALAPFSAHAIEQTKRGLSVTPVRQELTAEPGRVTNASYEVANYNDKPLTVMMSVKKFNVTDYSYAYKFSDDNDKWITFENPQVVLQPQQKFKMKYTVTVPSSAAPGGYYFALLASAASGPTGGISQTAQVASMLFIKAGGQLTRQGTISNPQVPFLVMGNTVSYKFDVRNTGNVHYAADFYGQLEGLFGKMPSTSASHILMPGAVRAVGGSVDSPVWPGVYIFNYGYKTETDNTPTYKSSYILFVPPWSIAALFILLIIGRSAWRVKHKKKSKAQSD